MSASRLPFQMDEPNRADNYGGIDAMRLTGQESGLTEKKVPARPGGIGYAERRVGLPGQPKRHLFWPRLLILKPPPPEGRCRCS